MTWRLAEAPLRRGLSGLPLAARLDEIWVTVGRAGLWVAAAAGGGAGGRATGCRQAACRRQRVSLEAVSRRQAYHEMNCWPPSMS